MARLAAQKRKSAFALILAVCSIFQAAFSQSIKNLEPLQLSEMSPAVGETKRLTASIPPAAVKVLGTFTFVAFFKFPSSDGIAGFAARPRVPPIQEKDWYIKEDIYCTEVHAAVKLPADAGHQSTHQPEIVIDVQCDGCDLAKATVSFEEFSEASFTNKRLYHAFIYARETTGGRGYKFNAVKSGDKSTSWKAELNREELCSSLQGAWLEFYEKSKAALIAHWTSNTISRDAELIKDVYDSWNRTVFRPDDEGQDLCNPGSDGKIFLELSCEVECELDVGGVYVYFFDGPQPPFGASSKSVSVKGVWGEEAAACSVQPEDSEQLEMEGLDKSDIFRLWYNAGEGCKTTRSQTQTSSQDALDWESRQKVHRAEGQLNNGTAARARLEGVEQCVCEGLEGRVYRLLDGGPVDQYTPRSFTVRPPNDRGPATAAPRNSPKGSEATGDQTRADDRSGTDQPMTRNPVTAVAASPVGSTRQGAVSIGKLLFNTTTGKVISEGHLVFENWISEANSEPDVPFVTMLCLSPKGSSGGSSIQSVSLEGEGELKRFQTPEDSNYTCYAFDACDAWKAGYPERLPKITVVGKNVSERLRWRLDEAIPFGNSSSSEIRIGRGGQYGSAEQRKRLQGVEKLVETKLEKTSSSVRCVDAPSKIRGSQTSGADPGEVASAVYVRPPYQLDPNVTLSYSGDGRSFSMTAFLGAFVVVVIRSLQGRRCQ